MIQEEPDWPGGTQSPAQRRSQWRQAGGERRMCQVKLPWIQRPWSRQREGGAVGTSTVHPLTCCSSRPPCCWMLSLGSAVAQRRTIVSCHESHTPINGLCLKDDPCAPWLASRKINGSFPSHHQITQKIHLLASYKCHKESSVKILKMDEDNFVMI